MGFANTPTLAPFDHSGGSANIAFYGERRPQSPDRIWCEVLRSDVTFGSKDRYGRATVTAKRVPDFHVTVYKGTSAHEIARFTYTPRSRPKPGALSARTVARLVREALS